MFRTLEEEIEQVEEQQKLGVRALKYVALVLVTSAIFGALYLGIRFVE